MPVTFSMLPSFGVTSFQSFGESSLDECITAIESYVRHPDFDGSHHLLFDQTHYLLGSETYSRLAELAPSLAFLFDARTPQSKTAFYCPEDLQYAAARLYEVISASRTSRQIGVFRTRSEATSFLGIDPNDHEAAKALWAA